MRKVFMGVILTGFLFVTGFGIMKTPTLVNLDTNQKHFETDENLITVSYTGDVTLGSYKGSDNKFSRIYQDNGPEYFLQNVEPIFARDDVTLVNLEGPLCDNEQEVQKQFSMKGEPAYTDILTAGSVETVNLSNNHIYDCGETGFKQTLENLDTAGITYSGEDYITGYSANGTTIYFLGYKAFADTEALRQNIREDIQTLKNTYDADIVVVSFHWGEEYNNYPNTVQQELAHFAVDNGADTVIGHHPHVLQGIEEYNGKVIAYSLGNFCFGGNNNPKDKDTAILQITYDEKGNIYHTDVIPCSISSEENTNNFQPVIADPTTSVRIVNRLIEYSNVFEYSIDWNLFQ